MNQTSREFSFQQLETERTWLRILTLDDTEAVYRHFSDGEVTRFMDIEPCAGLSDARDIIVFHQKDAGCRWGEFLKETESLVGTCGHHGWERGHVTPMAEVGFDLGPAYWGRGLMHEVLQTVIPFGLNRWMSRRSTRASSRRISDRSIRLLDRLNFRREPEFRGGLERFSLFKDDWQTRAG